MMYQSRNTKLSRDIIPAEEYVKSLPKWYHCTHIVLLAHARAYRIYESSFKKFQRGKVGIAVSFNWFRPASTKKEDVEMADTFRQFKVTKVYTVTLYLY